MALSTLRSPPAKGPALPGHEVPEMGRKSTKQLTETEFKKLRPHLSALKERSIEIAHEHLVNGRLQTAIAEEHGITKKAVSQIIGNVWEVFLDKGARPDGWVSFDVCLPPAMADAVKQMERTALMNARRGKR
jgi:hypothetical protein